MSYEYDLGAVSVDGRLLRRGITTGTCAAAAASAAATGLLSGYFPKSVRVALPNGESVSVGINAGFFEGGAAVCSVVKFAGDDPDVTDGAEIFARVSRIEYGTEIDGGEGVGRVTKNGLDRPAGEAAINSTPRKMITDALLSAAAAFDYGGGMRAVISVPGGEKLAEKTFNPRLGIVGGISILGTTGVVEPMSNEAVIATIRTEVTQKAALGTQNILLVPGNYGERFISEKLGINAESAVKCSNFIGAALDICCGAGVKSALLVSHIGKAVKLGCGIMNTHSREGDARAEVMAACALKAGCGGDTARKILDSAVCDDMLEIMGEYRAAAMKELGGRIGFYTDKRVRGAIDTGFIVFSDRYGILCRSDNAEKLLKQALEE